MDRGSLCAFTCRDWQNHEVLADDVLVPLARNWSDRVGVALSAAARDEQLILPSAPR